MTKPVVGFIGTGIMGCSMASHLMAAGFDLHIYNRTQEKATSLIEKGAKWHDTPADLAPHCDIIITMVGYPKDVEAIYFGPQGLIARSKADTLLIDMTTSSPALARWIANEAEACQKFRFGPHSFIVFINIAPLKAGQSIRLCCPYPAGGLFNPF